MHPPDADPLRALSPRARAFTILILLLLIGGAAVGIVWSMRHNEPEDPRQEVSRAPNRFAMYSGLRDNAEVIGVSAAGRHRAYLLQTFLQADSHVYNDLLGAVPLTVTYCDLADCARVFTAPGPAQPLDVAVGGWDGVHHRKMLLRVGSIRYWQETGLPLAKAGSPFPYAGMKFVRTTWGHWRKDHPDTDVYVGTLPGGPTDPTIRLAAPTLRDEGVQVRLRAERDGPAEALILKADIRNQGKRRFLLRMTAETCELEVDGRRLAWRGPAPGNPVTLGPTDLLEGVVIGRVSQGQDKTDKELLHLDAGKHSVCAVFVLEPADNGTRLRVRSDPVEIEVTGAGGEKPGRPAK
jgi:hypothetical protein